MISPEPRPAIRRPTRSMGNVCARPATADPVASSVCPANREGSGPCRSDQTPASTMPSSSEVSISENASPYERTASRSLATLGIAVEMAIASNATMVTSARSATVSHLYAELIGPPRPRAKASTERPVVVIGSGVLTAPSHQMRSRSEWVHGRAVSQTVVSVGTVPEAVSGPLDTSMVVPGGTVTGLGPKLVMTRTGKPVAGSLTRASTSAG